MTVLAKPIFFSLLLRPICFLSNDTSPLKVLTTARLARRKILSVMIRLRRACVIKQGNVDLMNFLQCWCLSS